MSNTSRAPLAVSIDEACRLLGIGKSKLYLEINAGRLTAVKVGAKTLLPTQQFAGWLKSLPRSKAYGTSTGDDRQRPNAA